MASVPIETLGKSLRGAFVSESNGALSIRRLPDWASAQFPDDAWLEIVSRMAAGVRLEFFTDATTFTLRARFWRYLFGADRVDELRPTDEQLLGAGLPDPVVTVVAAGTVQHLKVAGAAVVVAPSRGRVGLPTTALSTLTFEVGPSAAGQIVTIWLPQASSVEIDSVDANGTVLAAKRERPRWIHYGSSISQCAEATTPILAWPVAASEELELDLTNLGLGGNAQLDPFAARTIRDLAADLITLEVGINIVNSASMRERTFVPAVHGFIDTIREAHPSTPIVLISPIFCPGHENHPGPTVIVGGKAMSQARVADPDQLTLVRIRALLSDVVANRVDPRLKYLDGLQLLSSHEGHLLPDGLHPDDAGYSLIAERFVGQLRAQGLAT